MILSTATLTGITEKPSLFEAVDFICGFTDTNSGASAYPYADRLRNTNIWRYKFAIEAWKADGSWTFDDSNYTDFPIATTTLINGQADYALPSSLLKLERVSYKNSSGDYVDLEYLDKRTLPELGNDDAGLPTGYYLIGNSIFLYPKPDTSLLTATAGIRLYFKREVVELTKSDASADLGVPEPFVDFITNGVARDYCVRNDMSRLQVIDTDIERLKIEIKDFFNKRLTSKNPRLTRKYNSYE
jgi:hypothetical protein